MRPWPGRTPYPPCVPHVRVRVTRTSGGSGPNPCRRRTRRPPSRSRRRRRRGRRRLPHPRRLDPSTAVAQHVRANSCKRTCERMDSMRGHQRRPFARRYRARDTLHHAGSARSASARWLALSAGPRAPASRSGRGRARPGFSPSFEVTPARSVRCASPMWTSATSLVSTSPPRRLARRAPSRLIRAGSSPGERCAGRRSRSLRRAGLQSHHARTTASCSTRPPSNLARSAKPHRADEWAITLVMLLEPRSTRCADESACGGVPQGLEPRLAEWGTTGSGSARPVPGPRPVERGTRPVARR